VKSCAAREDFRRNSDIEGGGRRRIQHRGDRFIPRINLVPRRILEFDPAMVKAFIEMMRRSETKVRTLTDVTSALQLDS
jgi:hypothetical protein